MNKEDRKMKTIAYNPQKEIKTIIVLMVLTFAFVLAKAQDLPTQPTLESFTASISAPGNTLIGTNDSQAPASSDDLAAELDSMMSSGSYWNTANDTQSSEDNLTQMLDDWMKNGQYWEENQKPQIELNPQAIAEIEGQ